MAAMNQKSPIPRIVNHELYDALVDENRRLREQLLQVCSVGISSMFHTHRGEAEQFSDSVLKGVAKIMQRLKYKDLHQIYEQGYNLASAPSVLDKHPEHGLYADD